MRQFDLVFKVFLGAFIIALAAFLLTGLDFKAAFKPAIRTAVLCLAVFLILAVILSKLYKPVPPCENGTCTDVMSDYAAVGEEDAETQTQVNGIKLQCKCGRNYLLRKKEFLIITETGELKPYKKRKLLRWKDV